MVTHHVVSWMVIGVALFSSTSQSQADGTVSIADNPAYTLLRTCARCILEYCSFLDGQYDIDDWLQANGYNAGYCRGDFTSQVNSYISSQASRYCSPKPVTGDISSVISLYSIYCEQAVGPLTVAASTSTTTLILSTTTLQASAAPAPGTPSAGNTASFVTSTTVEITTATATAGSNAGSVAMTSATSKWFPLPLFLALLGGAFFQVRELPLFISLRTSLPFTLQ